jgi:hypothetical protein
MLEISHCQDNRLTDGAEEVAFKNYASTSRKKHFFVVVAETTRIFTKNRVCMCVCVCVCVYVCMYVCQRIRNEEDIRSVQINRISF